MDAVLREQMRKSEQEAREYYRRRQSPGERPPAAYTEPEPVVRREEYADVAREAAGAAGPKTAYGGPDFAQEMRSYPPVMRTARQPSLLRGMGIDTETALIAALIYILMKQGADNELLLALGYILVG